MPLAEMVKSSGLVARSGMERTPSLRSIRFPGAASIAPTLALIRVSRPLEWPTASSPMTGGAPSRKVRDASLMV